MKLFILIFVTYASHAHTISPEAYDNLYQETLLKYETEMKEYSEEKLAMLNSEYEKAVKEFDKHQKEYEDVMKENALKQQTEQRLKDKAYKNHQEEVLRSMESVDAEEV